jgi:hypothetical protein
VKQARGAILLALAAATVTPVACSTAPFQASPSHLSHPSEDGTGLVGLKYTLPSGEHISAVSYVLTNGTNSYAGTINVSMANTISFVIAGVASGSGYNITLNATSDDGTVTCTGTAGPFSVANRTTTSVNVNLQCVVPTDAGSVLVSVPTSNCPVWNTIVADPNMACRTTTLTAAARAPDPGGLTFTWTVASGTGTISNNTTMLTADDAGMTDTAIFTCPEFGETDTITLVVGDGPVIDGGACPAALNTGSVTVTCGCPPACTLPGETSVAAVPDTAAGTCSLTDPLNGKPLVNSGVPDSRGDFCCIDACGGGPTATPFSPTGTCIAPLVNDGAGCCVGLQPCTPGGPANCVQCQLNDTAPIADKTCTQTEAQFVAYDIKQGRATAPGPDPVGSCYTCLAAFGCLDDTHLGDRNSECDDPIVITVGTPAQCHAVIDCTLASNMGMGTCAKASIAGCYCGTAGLTTTCRGNPSAANGVCDAVIAAGLGFPTQDGTDVTAHYTDLTRAGGIANLIFSCAQANSCAACFN